MCTIKKLNVAFKINTVPKTAGAALCYKGQSS